MFSEGGVGCVLFFKQKTAYEMRISDWSSDVCSSDLPERGWRAPDRGWPRPAGYPSMMLHLASKSPRRRELLGRLGLEFGVLDLDVPEQREPGEGPADY